MTRSSLSAGLLLASLLACQPGTSPHPASVADQFSISGTVTGPGAAGVAVSAVSAAWAPAVATVTDASGRFRITGLRRGQYALTVSVGETVEVTPASRSVTLFDRDASGQDFALASVNVVQGTIAGGVAAGTPVTVTGPVTRVVGCDGSGFYRVGDLPGGTYTVRPASASDVFTPASALVALGGGAVTTQDFGRAAAVAATHLVSGTVAGPAAAGVVLTLSGANSGTTQSDAGGHYAFEGLANGVYQVTASPVSGLLYRSRGRDATLAGADVSGLDFTQYLPATARWAYVMASTPPAGPWAIYQYAVGAGGALAPLAPPTVATSSSGLTAADPSGRYLYATSTGTNTVAQYTIGDDGQLSPMSPASVPCATGPNLIAVDPGGQWLWVHNQTSGDLRRFTIGAGGALTPGADPPSSVGAAVALVVHPSGRYLYVVSSGTTLQFAVAGAGSLSAISPPSLALPPADAGSSLARLAFDPSGRFGYLTVSDTINHRAWVVPYSVGTAGALTWLGAQYAWPQGWSQIYYGPVELVAEPSGRFLYVAPDGGAYYYPLRTLTPLALGPDGVPAPISQYTVDGGRCPAHVAADPTGSYLFAANVANDPANVATDGTVAWFTIGGEGQLTRQGTAGTGLSAQSITVVSR